MTAKKNAKISELEHQIRCAEKAGDLALMNKLRRIRAGTMGGIARQQKKAQAVAERRKAIINRWEELKPRPDELFELAIQHEVIKLIAEEFGLSADYIREITAIRRD